MLKTCAVCGRHRRGIECGDAELARMLLRRITLVLSLLLLVPAMVLAQDADVVSTDNVELLPLARPIVEYTLAGAILVAALAIGLMPSRRVKDA